MFKVNSADTINTLECLKETMTIFRIPNIIISDNSSCFTSHEFSKFCTYFSIKHFTILPYNPASNR